MRNQSRLILSFIAGAAAGAAIAYLVTSDKGEEIISEIRNLAGKLRDNMSDKINKSGAAKDEEADEEFMGV